MNAETENGELVVKILDEYMQSFQFSNPNMQVFSIHLHMDEATPYLHIDFVPFTMGKCGLNKEYRSNRLLQHRDLTTGADRKQNEINGVYAEKNSLRRSWNATALNGNKRKRTKSIYLSWITKRKNAQKKYRSWKRKNRLIKYKPD
jgi:hypothetical protein